MGAKREKNKEQGTRITFLEITERFEHLLRILGRRNSLQPLCKSHSDDKCSGGTTWGLGGPVPPNPKIRQKL